MKAKIIFGFFVMGFLCVPTAYAQTTFVLTTNSATINNNRAPIDHPQLNDNSQAIIVVTPLADNFGNQYPFPVAVWFMPADSKWYVINADQSKMQANKLFEIKFWRGPDANHFVHRVTKANLKNGATRIDNPALDNHPRASFEAFPMRSHVTGDTVNDNAPYPKYNEAEKKWYIESANGKGIYEYNAFNIVIQSSGTPGMTRPDLNLSNSKSPSSTTSLTAPTGTAGGDLSGTFPNPNVIGLQGRPLSAAQPKVGDTLKWSGSEWIPASEEQTVVTQTTPFPNATPTPSGNMVEPLKFKPVLGKKIVFYPGQTGDVGIGVAGNLLQIYSDNPNADVAIGYDQNGTFKERFRVKANGALEVNGNAGKPGEVLVSKGPGEPPVWSPMSTPVYAFANCGPDGPNTLLAIKCAVGPVKENESAPIEGLRMYLSLKKPSIVVVNGRFIGANPIGSTQALFVTANGARVSPLMRVSTTQYLSAFQITDVMFRLEPGNHTIDWRLMAFSQSGGIAGEFASLTAYPIE